MRKLYLIALLLLSCETYSQTQKNAVELGVLGNIGFFDLGYSRRILNVKNFDLDLSSKVGYVPGSKGNETEDPTPNFTHLNLGTNLSRFTSLGRFGIGINYSKIFVGNNQNNARAKSNYNRIIGDLSYTLYINAKDEIHPRAVKVSFTPIIYDDDANDIEDIPVRIGFTYEF